MKNSKLRLMLAAISIGLSSQFAHAGGGGMGVGGATEITQLWNNGELVKSGIDTAQTAATTVSQYMTQLEQYRNQLLNTIGLDPSIVGEEVRKIANTYQQVSSYQYRLQGLKGSLEQQKYVWDDRVARARSGNLRLSDYMAIEKQKAEQGNKVALERLNENKRVLEQTMRDIEDVNQSRARLPGALGQNQSIHELHGVTSKIAVQNATLISLQAQRDIEQKEKELDENAQKELERRRLLDQERANRAVEQRQKRFLGDWSAK